MIPDISFDVTDKDFLDLVALEVRGELDGNTSRHLRADEKIDNFHRGLICLKRNVETQLSNKKSRTIKETYNLKTHNGSQNEIEEILKDYADWRAKAVRFLGAIELEISETKSRMKTIFDNTDYVDELIELIGAQMQELDENDYTEADEKMFEVAKKIRESN